MSSALPPADAPMTAPPSRASAGMERIVAIALAAMAAVLFLVWTDLVRISPAPRPTPFDWQNPLLVAQPGGCVEVTDASMPGEKVWLVVREPGVVLRPASGPATIPGWAGTSHTDPKRFPPYLLCEARRGGGSRVVGSSAPPENTEVLVFPLNGFGMPLEATCVLNDMQPQAMDWAGQRRQGYAVGLRRYGRLEGPWVVYMSRDAPVLGTAMRKYLQGMTEMSQSFLVPEGCR